MISRDKIAGGRDKAAVVSSICEQLGADGYSIFEINADKPWGAYVRLENSDAKRFINEYFPGLSFEEACLGVEGAELSPKILYVEPGARLSWQYHSQRAERWAFLSEGLYKRSLKDEQGESIVAPAGSVVQFAATERHRLEGSPKGFTLVAEIWQHSDPSNFSTEEDIIRLDDDYSR